MTWSTLQAMTCLQPCASAAYRSATSPASFGRMSTSNAFDHFVKRELRCPSYLRYVDDFLLFSDDKQQLWDWKQAIERSLAGLRLTIHPGAHPMPVEEGFPFLGFYDFPTAPPDQTQKGDILL